MKSLLEQDKNYILNLYNRINIDVDRGEGVYLYDINGYKYFDMFSGISVTNLGHSHKEILSRIVNQASRYLHLSNYFACESTVNLARLLVENTFASKVFFTNSGTESIEAAIKLCRKYGKKFNSDKYEIVSAYNSFHGRTCGGLSLTGQEKYQKDFTPLLPGVSHFIYNDVNDLIEKVSDKTCAVFLEIIQGEGGIVEISQEFMDSLVELSKKHNFLIVIDEIQTGLGRTGNVFAFEKFNFTPHVVTIAKSLGGGLPLGAMLVSKEVENEFQPGDHGTTFGGNPLSCAAGEYVVSEVVNSNLCEEVKTKGDYLIEELNKLKQKFPSIINEVRGRGLMIGVEVGKYANDIKEKAFDKKLLLNVTNKSVIRLLPSLNIKINELEYFLELFEEILSDIS